jgi:hypothetical protein
MPIATVDLINTKVKLFYTDTGPVDSNDYTTLVIYHGLGFTGRKQASLLFPRCSRLIWLETDTFNKLLPLVPSSNIRLVIITRRDYDSHDEFDSPGSTPHSDEELEDLHAGREIFLERLGLAVANFLLWFVDTHEIPKICDDGKLGGFSVMGWSLGGLGPLALLGHPDVVPKESQKKLASYFRQLIFYGAFLSHDLR